MKYIMFFIAILFSIIFSLVVGGEGVINIGDISSYPFEKGRLNDQISIYLSTFSNLRSYYGSDFSYFGYTFFLFYNKMLFYIAPNGNIVQILYTAIYYILSFVFGILSLKEYFKHTGDNIQLSKSKSYIIGIFLAFNPFSITFIYLYGYAYIYPFIFITLYYLTKFLSSKKIHFSHISIITFSFVIFISYLRILPILIIMFFLIMLPIIKIYKPYKKILLLSTILLLFLLPFIYHHLSSFLVKTDAYSNYINYYNKFDNNNYNFKSNFLLTLSNHSSYTNNFYGMSYNNFGRYGFVDFAYNKNSSLSFYLLIQIFFNLLIIILLGLKKSKGLPTYFITIVLLIYFLNGLGSFIDIETFKYLNEKLKFLYNDYGFLQLVQTVINAFIIFLLLHYYKGKWLKYIVIIFLMVNVFPSFKYNIGLLDCGNKDEITNNKCYFFSKFKYKNIPENYSSFYNENTYNQGIVFLPSKRQKYTWSPYNIDLDRIYGVSKNILFSNDPRLNSEYKDTNTVMNSPHFYTSNLSMYGNDGILLSKDVDNSKGQIDNWSNKDYKKLFTYYHTQLKNNNNFYVESENDNYILFRPKSFKKNNFLLFSPNNINYSANLKESLLFKTSGSREMFTNNKKLLSHNKNLNKETQVSIKSSKNTPTKYFVKIGNFNDNKSTLIQFNQSFSPYWKLKWITKDDYEKHECINKNESFTQTNNTFCKYNGSLLNLSDYKFLKNKNISEENHYKGNYIGNTWVIPKGSKSSNKSEVYAVIIYEKQIYYIFTMIISGLVLALVVIIAIAQSIIIIINKRNER